MNRAAIREAWRHWRAGRRYGYPACCVTTFALAHLCGRGGAQAVTRGTCRTPQGQSYVACRLHQHHATWQPYSSEGLGGWAMGYERRGRKVWVLVGEPLAWHHLAPGDLYRFPGGTAHTGAAHARTKCS